MRTPLRVTVVVLAQLLLVGVAVLPQLSARATGEEYLFRVQLVDPIDPFRGAYVALAYPDLDPRDNRAGDSKREAGTVYLNLVEDNGVWRTDEIATERPDAGPYLRCHDSGWSLDCGIDSYFLPQDKAAAFEKLVAAGDAVARVRIDGRGDAALIDIARR
ncbi:MAG: GDYXXLXY domain-containing protein [Nocardioides sp.]|uniref:GDYXXLXY domain-containing protein n=1 Tax=Nocardioides sp. TaxID=35761 RepID=UPI0039E3DE4C